MANFRHHEGKINAINSALLETMNAGADGEKSINLFNLITRYSFDVMFATTAGAAPGFLAGKVDVQGISDAMNNWKLYSVALGSYFRLQEIINSFFRNFDPSNFERQVLDRFNSVTDDNASGMLKSMLLKIGKGGTKAVAAREACAALIAASTDPIITHIAAAIFYIYHDTNLIKDLRKELSLAKVHQPAKAEDLIRKKDKMPLLHTCLCESLRLHYNKSPEDDISYGVAFGSNLSNRDLHFAIVAKVLTLIVSKYDITIDSEPGVYTLTPATEIKVTSRGRPVVSSTTKQSITKAAAPAPKPVAEGEVKKENTTTSANGCATTNKISTSPIKATLAAPRSRSISPPPVSDFMAPGGSNAKVWQNFAVSAPTAYKKAIDDYVRPEPKPESEKPAGFSAIKAQETFTLTKRPQVQLPKRASAEPIVPPPSPKLPADGFIPPHLRARFAQKAEN
jgi:hypothetical protein